MDETGFRIGIPGGERVIVPRTAKELYTPSPKNRTTITALETVSASGKSIPPLLVIPGKIHMDSWYHENLKATALRTAYSSSRRASSNRPAPGTRPTARTTAGGRVEEAGEPKPGPASKAELAAQKLAAKEARRARQAANQAWKQLRRAGIEARKEERLRKKAVAQFRKEGLLIPPELEVPIRDPEAPETDSESGSESGSGSGGSGSEEVIIS
ncbi:hypothetical protein V498_06310 [Pseudogymnoascus sp. VKM F-4517 (FW-2822)]|nr:hypothetical protein V498_06310 [Pseudogymnoascus sp. VKM F-4517 (FW-2822)]